MTLQDLSFDLSSLQSAYQRGLDVRALIAEAQRRAAGDAHHAFIHRLRYRFHIHTTHFREIRLAFGLRHLDRFVNRGRFASH
mgnify:CR=1 FL=1